MASEEKEEQGRTSNSVNSLSSSFTGSNQQDKFDKTRTEAFAGKMFDILNGGTISLMVSIGHQTRLFDVMSKLPSSTSEEIAQSANLNERYVREWLGAMVTDRKSTRLNSSHANIPNPV